MTRKRKTFVPGRKPPKARKTFVVNYVNQNGFQKQIYCRNYNEAQKESAKLRKEGIRHRHISSWIDGAEVVRLARLGYEYDNKKKRTVKMKHHPQKFLQEVDSMPKERRDQLFLDYRKFKTSDDLIAFYKKRKG